MGNRLPLPDAKSFRQGWRSDNRIKSNSCRARVRASGQPYVAGRDITRLTRVMSLEESGKVAQLDTGLA